MPLFQPSSAAVTIKDEGASLATAASSLDFVGAGVTAAGTTADKTITIPGAGSVVIAKITAASAAIADTETVVASATLGAGSLVAGSSFRISAAGVGTTGATPGNDTFRIRIGPTTLTGVIPTSVAPPANASVTAQPFAFEALVTIRTIGATGTAIGECRANGDDVSAGLFTVLNDLSATTAAVTIDTTVANLIELTFQSGATNSSATFHVAAIEALVPGAVPAAGAAAFAGVRAKRTTAQTIATATLTALALDAADDIDTDAYHDTVTNNSRLTVPSGKAGRYMINGRCQWGANTTGIRLLSIRLNGTTILDEDERTATTASVDGRTNQVATLYTLAVGDYLELMLYQTSGGDLATRAAGEGNHFEMWLAGA